MSGRADAPAARPGPHTEGMTRTRRPGTPRPGGRRPGAVALRAVALRAVALLAVAACAGCSLIAGPGPGPTPSGTSAGTPAAPSGMSAGTPAAPSGTTWIPGASPARAGQVTATVTTADRTRLLTTIPAGTMRTGTATRGAVVRVDPATRYQEIDGFGAAMTDSSSWLLDTGLDPAARDGLLRELFSPTDGIGLSVVRVPVGPSDFTYDGRSVTPQDAPTGPFSIDRDLQHTVPLLREALADSGGTLRLVASPWSAPAWMKTTDTLDGGSLRPDAEGAYAQYLVRFAQAYAAQGLGLWAMAVQNEPLHESTAYPSMLMPADQQARFVAQDLGPAFAQAGLGTKIMAYDHNWDRPDYPLAVLADPAAARYLAGTAFHCYGGDPTTAQTQVHDAAPTLGIWLTECSDGAWVGDFGDALISSTRSVVLPSLRAWSRGVLLWNLALDASGGPTNGGCTTCHGVVTVAGGTVTRGAGYYVLAQLSRFVRPGAVRVASSTDVGPGGHVGTVAFVDPDGTRVLVLVNDDTRPHPVTVREGRRGVVETLPARSVSTLTWR